MEITGQRAFWITASATLPIVEQVQTTSDAPDSASRRIAAAVSSRIDSVTVPVVKSVLWVTVAITIASGIDYILVGNRKLGDVG